MLIQKLRNLCLTWQDVDVFESLQAALGPLSDFTDSLCAENEITTSAINAVLHIFKTDVLKESSDDTELTSDIKRGILEYMNSKYEPDNVKQLLNLSSFLDPRFCSTYINDDDKDEVFDTIVNEGAAILTAESSSSSSTTNTEGDSNEDESQPKTKKRKLGSWLANSAESVSLEELFPKMK